MAELDTILRTWRGGIENAVLATVVHVTGSAYRRPGAKMLLCHDGTRFGSISGGCLEGDLARKAWWLTGAGAPVVQVYDTTSDDDAVWEFGLGCNGVIHVLLERIENAHEALTHLQNWRTARRQGVVATVIAGEFPIGSRLFLEADGGVSGSLTGSQLETAIAAEARSIFKERTSRLLHHPAAEILLEWVGPPQRVVVFGAGHDVMPVVSIANTMGWRVAVADGRPAYARAERFPGAEKVVVLSPQSDIHDLAIDSDTAVVLMTHNLPLDKRLLRKILPLRPCYLGLLGPTRRTERLFEEIGENRHAFDLHAPIGLDVGGDSPESVALSIVAEIQAALHRRAGGMLRLRCGAIHSPALESGVAGAFPLPQLETAVTCELHG